MLALFTGIALAGIPFVIGRHLWQTRALVLKQYSNISVEDRPQVSLENMNKVRNKLISMLEQRKSINHDSVDPRDIYFNYIKPHHTNVNHDQIMTLLGDEGKLEQLISHNKEFAAQEKPQTKPEQILPKMLGN